MAYTGITSLAGIRTAPISGQDYNVEGAGKLVAAVALISPGQSLFCVCRYSFAGEYTGTADASAIETLFPLGICQGVQVNENNQQMYIPEIGSHRRRAYQGPSQGGTISISRVETGKQSLLQKLAYFMSVEGGNTTGIDPTSWMENPELANTLEHDFFRANTFGFLIAERTQLPTAPARIVLYEQCLVGPGGKAYQAGQNMVLANVTIPYERATPISIKAS